jgi:hypothetical protein
MGVVGSSLHSFGWVALQKGDMVALVGSRWAHLRYVTAPAWQISSWVVHRRA